MMILGKTLKTLDTMDLGQDHALNVNRGETHQEADIEENIETLQEAEVETENTQTGAAAEKEEEGATMELIGQGGKAMAKMGDTERITQSP